MYDSPYIVCTNCGHKNLSRDYCENCGAIINKYLKRRLERKQREKEQMAQGNKVSIIFENAKRHPNVFVRGVATFFYSIWVLVIAIGSFLAFIIGYIAA